jgi:serine/threonine-protein kinase
VSHARKGGAGTPGDASDRFLGTVLDERFLLKSLLGTGGMGTVYRAQQYSMDRDVAVKVLRADATQDDQAVRRFLTEARAASRLKSPHTVTVFDFGRTKDGILYIAMELMEGRTLAQVLQDEGKPFGMVRSTRLINQVLDSMEEAHGVGILHRDLKPDNVFLLEGAGSRDFVKVLDFGVAKMVGESRAGATLSGLTFGTPVYMSPEQMMGRDVGPWTDLYAVAVMLFELIAGQPPLDEPSPVEMAIRKDEGRLPSLRDVNPDAETVPDLDAFLVRAMSPTPADRPFDVETFREELNRAVRNATTGPRPHPVPWRGDAAAEAVPEPEPVVAPVAAEPDDDAEFPFEADIPTESGVPAPFVGEDDVAEPQPVVHATAYFGTLVDPEPLPPVQEPQPVQAATAFFGTLVLPPAEPFEPAPPLPEPPPEPQEPPLEPPPQTPPEPPPPQAPPEPPPPPPPPVEAPIPPRRVLPHRPKTASRGPERRTRPRTPRLHAVVCLADGHRHRALVADISEAGAFVHSQWLPAAGQGITLLFDTPEEAAGPAIVLICDVIRVIEIPVAPGDVRGFSVAWRLLRTQGRLSRLLDFYRDVFDADLPTIQPSTADAHLWEFRFDERQLHRDSDLAPRT